MATQTPQQITQYYAGLLILQYLGKPKAYGTMQALASQAILPQTTVQDISFSEPPSSGTWVLNYGDDSTSTINWNDTAATIQGYLRVISGLGSVTVSGSVSAGLVVTFTGVIPVALSLTITSNTMGVTPTIVETDVVLPLAVQDAFNLVGDNVAQGVQLDVLGKYAGVVRSGFGFSGQPITLDDEDFLTLIQFAIIKNSAGSSLATIQSLIFQYFPHEVLVFDYQNMRMSYLISSSLGSQNLIQLLVNENELPAPMGVDVAIVIYAPVINTFFGFRTYELPAFNASPFNSYSSYNLTYPWLSYGDAA